MENLLNCFNGFVCRKGECRKTCCALWQVAVDKKTLHKYKKIKGDFSQRIQDGVDFNSSSLCLREGRCAFLNKDNLCDIIINLGKDYLGEVCTVHPKFITSFKGYSEVGIGISCEEGARLLFEFNGKIAPATPPNISKLKGFEREIILFREKVLEIIYQSCTLKEKILKILSLIGVEQKAFLSQPLSLTDLELLDKDWAPYRDSFKELSLDINSDIEKELTNLIAYFIYRHLINAVDVLDLKSRTLFSLFSTLAIHNIYNNSKNVQKDLSLLYEISRGYSAEIEYSEDNLFKILDGFDRLPLLNGIN